MSLRFGRIAWLNFDTPVVHLVGVFDARMPFRRIARESSSAPRRNGSC